MDKEKSSKIKEKAKSYLKWTKEMDRVLTSILLEQHKMGNQVPNGWKAPAYTAAITGIKEKCNIVITKDNILSRLKTWDKRCSIIAKMVGTSGIGWDNISNMVKVDDQAHPEASSYRYKVIENWNDLATICGHDHATGEGAETGVEGMKNIEQEENTNDINEIIFEGIIFETREPACLDKQSIMSRKRRRSSDPLLTIASDIAGTLKMACNAETTSTKASVEEIFIELSKVSDLEEMELLQSLDIISGDSRKYETFKVYAKNHMPVVPLSIVNVRQTFSAKI
ncbi:hypothetical protein RIF29_06534 [Crotalaria pallida]|uniref:Myb/SANT-like domain-containing protein n=1 Tax=Crotalaria pallida TaxID=3830 RepID=A0AAN9PAE1_CROPI